MLNLKCHRKWSWYISSHYPRASLKEPRETSIVVVRVPDEVRTAHPRPRIKARYITA
jgi:hypothetical protein